jgi:NAD dependent epimerase/dehydratase family enzyme
MADELLLSGQHVLPTKLVANGFAFQYPTIDKTLQAILTP